MKEYAGRVGALWEAGRGWTIDHWTIHKSHHFSYDFFCYHFVHYDNCWLNSSVLFCSFLFCLSETIAIMMIVDLFYYHGCSSRCSLFCFLCVQFRFHFFIGCLVFRFPIFRGAIFTKKVWNVQRYRDFRGFLEGSKIVEQSQIDKKEGMDLMNRLVQGFCEGCTIHRDSRQLIRPIRRKSDLWMKQLAGKESLKWWPRSTRKNRDIAHMDQTNAFEIEMNGQHEFRTGLVVGDVLRAAV
jgi:hypothetical protein